MAVCLEFQTSGSSRQAEGAGHGHPPARRQAGPSGRRWSRAGTVSWPCAARPAVGRSYRVSGSEGEKYYAQVKRPQTPTGSDSGPLWRMMSCPVGRRAATATLAERRGNQHRSRRRLGAPEGDPQLRRRGGREGNGRGERNRWQVGVSEMHHKSRHSHNAKNTLAGKNRSPSIRRSATPMASLPQLRHPTRQSRAR